MTELWQIFCGDVNFLENQPFGQIRHFGAIFNWGSRAQFLGNRPDSFFVVLIYITKFGGNHFWGPSGPMGRELRGGAESAPPALNKLAESPPWIGLIIWWSLIPNVMLYHKPFIFKLWHRDSIGSNACWSVNLSDCGKNLTCSFSISFVLKILWN